MADGAVGGVQDWPSLVSWVPWYPCCESPESELAVEA